jgi:glutamate/aspartate transport system substrate-binding protein
VAFSVTIFVATSRLVSKRSSGIGALADLKGRIVVSTLGTTTIKRLPELNAERGLRMTILGVRDDAEAFRMVETDRAVAYAMDDVLLHSAVAGSSRPDDYVISDEALSVEPYAVMLGKADPAFKAMVDDAIKQLFASGELRRLYAKWFESPIPPKGINLRLKMPAAMRRVIERPTDSGDAADYH